MVNHLVILIDLQYNNRKINNHKLIFLLNQKWLDHHSEKNPQYNSLSFLNCNFVLLRIDLFKLYTNWKIIVFSISVSFMYCLIHTWRFIKRRSICVICLSCFSRTDITQTNFIKHLRMIIFLKCHLKVFFNFYKTYVIFVEYYWMREWCRLS